ncbi:VanZ family protein [Clostridium chauvoei]|uniref:VanZ family protein n=2 Tax=Clostridium chauvoei TaxID=46867 RepID=A0ABD4RKN3_9CLOT|nr:VanZ family protein [Clostridium chauvoei]ATD54028.1 hypothetical protein BTM20_01730 [Clostridium chauvoei]ATD58519.1 hypothetical protein BTM21_12720 [Clostridium chauvoei]MBX7281784.1 VanZ family protein [Clostridium chauvoei]MBX7284305.1 VanZ family protein [Clostridium chauvoei]MBX7286800.1 VanZ family protein [Clostridium chauvoei]
MKNKKKIIAWFMLIIWMSVIFFMSHQPGNISSNQSELVLKIFSFIGINLNDYFGELATLIVRKTAHFSEYLILFAFAYNVLILYTDKKSARICSLIFVFLYACSDEIHQYFIPGRAMAFKDILIDTSGGLFGFIIGYIHEKRKLLKSV